ncbi:MAG: CpaD family pilus assembly protein [Hyphomonadaceae bacterium]|nr:CpaD family pilus assembly protein [Hyphomonadaceae bacterium]
MNSRLPLLVVGLTALTACAGVPKPDLTQPPLASPVDLHEPTAVAAVARVEIAVAPGQTQLAGADRAQLQAFAGDYLRYGHGPLVLETPSGGANSEAASVLAADARRALAEAGVSYAAIAGSTRDASGEAMPILVSFNRFEARPPECAPLWEQDLAHQSNNQPWASFGCATNFNLAAMVEDPADLDHPRDMTARNSGRRDTVMDAYRQGDQTHADRSTDERITISNAVQ